MDMRNDQDVVNNILEVLLEYTQLDFRRSVTLSGRNDEFDAIAMGLNVIGEELSSHIDQLEKAHQEVLMRQQRFRALIDTAVDAIVIADHEGRIVLWNKGAEKIFGYPQEEAVGEELTLIMPEKYRESHEKAFAQFRETLHSRGVLGNTVELEGLRKDGTVFPAELSINSWQSQGEHQFIGIIRDISERKKTETAVRETAKFLDTVLENIPNMIFVKDANDLRFLRFNKAGEELLGYPREALLGKNDYDFFSPDKADFFTAKDRETINGGKLVDIPEERIQTNGRGDRWLHTKKIPVYNEQGEPLYLVGISEDITERKAAQEQLEQLNEELHAKNQALEAQQEKLRQANAELEEQTQKLREQQEELEASNEELEEQQLAIEASNKKLEVAHAELNRKKEHLEQANKYKSEFMANMSHELRSPLNSLLILAKDLGDNKRDNLRPDQVESAKIIYQSGQELLTLINDLLDLSKIEAGKMLINIETVYVADLIQHLRSKFEHLARDKGLDFKVHTAGGTPARIRSDGQRLGQVVGNLLSNAVKFTERGEVTLDIEPGNRDTLVVKVSDTGIGIAPEKQEIIFEAFQQADGGTSRKYGGTGLGLSIALQLARLLHGRLHVKSTAGSGSVFMLEVPIELSEESSIKTTLPAMTESDVATHTPAVFGVDDRDTIKSSDSTLLIIGSDHRLSGLVKRQANEKGFKCIVAASTKEGYELADRYLPDAILLHMDPEAPPGADFLDTLEKNRWLRNVPVHIISEDGRASIPPRAGAVQYLVKPTDPGELLKAFNRIEEFIRKQTKQLLIVEDHKETRDVLKNLLEHQQVTILEAQTAGEAQKILLSEKLDCLILDLMLPDQSGFDLIGELMKDPGYSLPPIIVYTGKDLSEDEVHKTREWAESIIVKGERSVERLKDEVALFLHKAIRDLPAEKQPGRSIHRDHNLRNKTVLLVDDDMRSVFALSKVLKDNGMNVLKAENGTKALDLLRQNNSPDIILMDVMMPEMDGYECMKRIREQPRHSNTPIIALTAKAMKDDREKCMAAGASDYFTKPVDVEKLLSLMHVWINQ